jgi:2-keto-3-deoxy-L-rhamnonate aldolase RhmA
VVAHFDLSMALGVHDEFESPTFVKAVTTLDRAVASSQVPVGGVAFTAEQTRTQIAKGYRVLFHGFDVLMLKELVATSATWT